MKKLVKNVVFFIFMLLMNFVVVCSVQAATTKINLLSVSEGDYTIGIHVNPGDHVVVYSDEDSEDYIFDATDFENECMDYEGYLFEDAPIKKQATHEANIRSGPGTKFDIVDRLVVGDIVNVVGKFDGVGDKWKWYLLADGSYVASHLFSDVSKKVEADSSNKTEYKIYLFEDGPTKKKAAKKANIRSGPGKQFSVLNSLSPGDVVNAIGTIDSIYSGWTWYILNDGAYVSAHLFKE